ncbi:MAG: hypothetical protein HY231_18645 [Acidobacteria bacterium]|nr:hypothetical protein [Acidobacteriota bacterium]
MLTEIFLLILTVAVLIMFAVITARNLPRRRLRHDERDTQKAADIERHPALLDKSQQAAELQIGEAEEVVRPARFQPDAHEKRNAATTGKR